MKKTFTAAALSSVLVLGLASSAFAVHATETAETATVAAGATKITLDGNVRVRGMYDKSTVGKDTPGATAYDTRIQLGTKAKVSDEATGYIKLESGQDSVDYDTWGNGDSAGLTTGGSKNGGVTILEAWVNYQPGAWGVKAGHMPLALGNKIFFDHTGSGDDALVFYANPTEATHIAALTIKFDEALGTTGNNDNSNDLDGYVALITHKVNDTLTLGANWTHLSGTAKDEYFTMQGYEYVDPTVNGVIDNVLVPGDLALNNIGLTADGKLGAISYMADVEFQFGTLFDDGSGVDGASLAGTTATLAGDSDVSGWAAKVGANYDLGAGKVGLLVGYGSGNDADATDNDTDTFVNFLTDTSYDTIIAGYRASIPGTGIGVDAKGKNTGLSNLTLYQLNGSTKTVCPLTGKDLSLFASATYMNLSEDIYNYAGNKEDKVGTELDLVATWALTAGLNYKVEAAYLFVGDVYKTSASSDPDDLMFLRHSLDMKF